MKLHGTIEITVKNGKRVVFNIMDGGDVFTTEQLSKLQEVANTLGALPFYSVEVFDG